MSQPRTVGDAMLRQPTVHGGDFTVRQARNAFAASPKTHLLLLVNDGVLVSTVSRDDLPGARATTPAARVGALHGRIVHPDAALEPTHEAMVRDGQRRLAVVDGGMRLLGLLCLKSSLSGFCTDSSIATMRAARQAAQRTALQPENTEHGVLLDPRRQRRPTPLAHRSALVSPSESTAGN